MTAAPETSHGRSATVAGVSYGVGAGALWGLVFLAPELTPGFGPLELTIGRYLCYGLIAAALIAPRWRSVAAKLTRRDWWTLIFLGLAGNTIYYILLAGAVQTGGIAMTSLVIGFLPVAVTVVGSRDHNAVPLRKLTLSLALCIAGAACIGGQAVFAPASGSITNQLIGLAFAIGALISWTSYAVSNQRALVRLTDVSSHDWNLMLGVVTGAQSLALLPVAMMLGSGAHTSTEWGWLIAVSAGVAILASILGNALWNRMSRLLPLTMVGQMILFETMFALIYGFMWEHRLPTILEACAFILIAGAVIACVAAHRQRPPAAVSV